MDELYRLHSCPIGSGSSNFNSNFSGFITDHHHHQQHHHQQFVLTGEEVAHDDQVTNTGLQISDLIKAQIASHPLYPILLSASIDCRKVGAPPEMASLFEEISRENQSFSTCSAIGTDPELDDFMKSYCEVLQKYKEELSKPFDEATSFLSSIESQLTNLCKETLLPPITNNSSFAYFSADDGGCQSDEDMSCGDLDASQSHDQSACNHHAGDHELKQMLMRKYSGYLSSLKKEFLKKRKKGKLPKDARTALLDWWNTHYRWPYPTEDEKNKLSEMTGLDQKQINNWFINQRKRHWRPSEDMRFALMEGVSGGGGVGSGSMYFDAAGGTGGIDT